MTNRRGKKFKNKGSLDPQSSSRVIEKSSKKGNKQRIPAAPIYAYAPAYQKVPAYATGIATTGSWGTVQGESVPCFDQGPGYIFMCNGKTKADCYRYRVFGLPHARMDILEKIKPYMKLFLFDFDLKLLYGVYVAASNGKLAIEPAAFGGKFSAQVRFEIFKDCLPLPESAFKHAIADNCMGGSKFRQELNNEQVANLISLFHPIAEPSSGIASSLMPNTIQPVTIIPRSIEMRTQPSAEISASDDQYLARLQPTHAGAAYFRHGRGRDLSLPHAPHAPTANMASLQPVLASQPLFDPFYPPDARRANFPQNPTLQSRYTAMPDDTERAIVQQSGPTNNYDKHKTVVGVTIAPVQAHAQFSTSEHRHEHLPSSSRTAAYWVQVASAGPKQVYSSPYQWIPPVSTGLGGQNIPVSVAGVASAYPAVQESRHRETVKQSSNINDYNHNISLAATNVHAPTESVMPLNFQAPSDRSAHLPSSSTATVYWAAPVSQDPAHVYSGPNQGLPSGGIGFGDGETIQQSSNVNDYNHNIALAATDVHAPTETVRPLHFQAPSELSAHLPTSSSADVYWAARVSQAPAHVYTGPDQGLPSGGIGFGGASQIYAAAPEKSLMENVRQLRYPYGYHHNIAVPSANVSLQAHDQLPSQIPAQLHGSSHTVSSSGAACYRIRVAYEDTSQVYLDPNRLSYGNSAAYNHNVVVSATTAPLQPPAYVSAASYDPSSSQVYAQGKAMNSEDPNQVYSGSHQMPSSRDGGQKEDVPISICWSNSDFALKQKRQNF